MLNAHILSALTPQLIAVTVLVATYVVLFTEKLNRAVAALLGASVMIFAGVLTQEQAIAGIDFNTICLLAGMMIIVGISEKTGMFQYAAVRAAKIVGASPRGILVMMALITAVFSALLDNVTTVLLIVPVTFQMTKQLKLEPYPFLILEIFASNIGGTATLIGDPPNILIGSALQLSFMDFVRELSWLVILNMGLLILIFDFFFGRKMVADPKDKAKIMASVETKFLTNRPLLKRSLSVLILVLCGFIFAERLGVENGTIALFGAAVLLLLYTLGDSAQKRDEKVEDAFSLVDWTTIFFFCGLFAIVYGLEITGILAWLGKEFVALTAGSVQKATFLVLWVSAVVSAFIDNIPFVATMIPILKSMEESLGGREAMMPVWWALSLGSCFGGNGSLIAASANVIVAGLASREGHTIAFGRFLFWSVPVMLLSIVVSTIYLYLVHFM
jgi:Na+/H+ antiporter NhaD/arsenite permease-like protein